jgi:hypothetical protein
MLHRKDYAAPFKLQRRLLLGSADDDVSTGCTDETRSTNTSAAATAAAAGDCVSTTASANVDSALDSSSDGYAYPGMPAVPEPFMVPLFKDSSSSRGRRKRGKGRSSTNATSSGSTDRQREGSRDSSELEQNSTVDAKAEH